ncbi:MAG: CehA/McbA family metallohydrolase [Verrucomicrobia bacterium]|nr:CehA/McbA family metallohydrolase [Verrucomicrobiota bacterium]
MRNRLNQEQTLLLDNLEDQFSAAEKIRAGSLRGLGALDAGYFHWQAEGRLLGLLKGIPDLVELDFRQGRPKPVQPLELDQRYGLLLLKVVTGDGPPHFRVHEMNMTTERDRAPYTILIGSNATTYIAVKLEQVPSDLTLVHVTFQEEGSDRRGIVWTLAFHSKPGGQVSIRVLDEDGQPVPVLLRLTSVAGGRLAEPAGALDLSPMLNDVTSLPIYGPGRGYMVYIPGPFQGRYWVVPRPFDMPLASGEWDVHIIHGIEYEPIRERFDVQAGKWVHKTYRLKRWTNMPRRGWYSGDDHVHSRLMSSEDAEKLMAFTRAADIHVSNVLEMGNEMRTWYAQRGFGPEFHVQEGNHWLIPGQEDPRSMLGHAIGLNLRSKVRDLEHYCLNDWIAEGIHRQGGLYGHTHVGNSEVKTLFTERQMALFTPMNMVDFNSILQNRLGVDLFYNYLNLGFKMTASAGSDTPYGGTVGSVRVYAHCGSRGPFSPARWFDALKRGCTFVTTGPMLDFRVEGARPGEEIVMSKPRPMRVTIRAWGLPGASAPVELRLIQFGRVIKEVLPAGKATAELKLETMITPEQSCWLAAQVRGANGSVAHTTPIYLVKPGTRFWDPTQAGPILKGQLKLLDEIEQAVAEAEQAMKRGNNPFDYWNRWPAEQAPQIRERVARMRKVYLDMVAELAGGRHPNSEGPRSAVATGAQVSSGSPP